MSYKTLYRKYRPKTFDDVVGQDHIILTLKNIIENDRVSHAYLFTGPRGTGKTSVANVFAREINRKQSGSIEIDAFDIIEIDAASNNGVAEVRDIIENSKYAPSVSKYKVYIVDEVHMLSKGAFNALLKTLEEPPKRVIFILATTEPHKIPVTILSRTQRFNFKRIEKKIIVNHLQKILSEENIEFSDEALKFISKLAEGGLRDALSIADQTASFGNNKISFEDISQVFGIISIDNQIKILNLAYKNDAKNLIMLINELIENGIDLERLVSSLLDVIKDYIFAKKTHDISLADFLSEEDLEKLKIDLEFAYHSADELVLLLNILKFSQIPKQIFELSILKIASKQEKYFPSKDVKEEKREDTQVIKTEEKEIANVFETSEQVVKEQPPIEEKAKDVDTQKIENTIENIADTQEIENDILSSQEDALEVDAASEKTDEMNLDQMFEIDKQDESILNEKIDAVFSADEIINLLQQATKEDTQSFKDILTNINQYKDLAVDPIYITLLRKVKFISKGDKFLLVSSDDEAVISQINEIKNNHDFMKFIKNTWKKEMHLFAITKDEFNDVKQKWSEYQSQNKFPEIKELKDIKIKEEEKTQAQKLHEDIFGELFK